MKKIFLPALIFLILLSSFALAVITSVNVSWTVSATQFNPGSDGTISLTFTNDGSNDLTRVEVVPIAGPSLKITSGKIDIGALKIGASQKASISFEVDEDAKSKISYISLPVKLYTGTSDSEKTFSIPITIRRKPILEIKNIKYNASTEPGSTVLLEFDIFNSGTGPAKNLEVKLNQTETFITVGSGELLISSLDKSEHAQFLITIDPDASIGTSSIPVSLSYYDETNTDSYSNQKTIGLTITGKPELAVSLADSENFYFGKVGAISISITNLGNAPAEYLIANAESEFGKKEVYVGKIESDEYETVEIEQNLANAKGPYKIYLTLSYKDSFNNEYEVKKTLELSPKSAPLEIPYTAIILLVIIIAGAWYWKRRKR